MTDLKQKLAHLMSPLGCGNNAYELGQLAYQQAELIEVLVKGLQEIDNEQSCGNWNAQETLQKAKEYGYE